MANFRGRLDLSRPYSSIQVSAYNRKGEKVATTITDSFGFYQLNDLATGTYGLKFYGGGYSSADWITISVVNDLSFLQFVITPENGTVIRNGVGEIKLQLNQVTGEGLTKVTSGPVKLYQKINGEFLPFSEASPGVEEYDDYSVTLTAPAVNGSINIYAVADAGYPAEFLYDSINVSDITDGVGFIGWVETSSYVAIKPDFQSSFSPPTITLTPKLAFNGVILDISDEVTAGNLTFSASPSNATGIAVSSDKVVTLTTADYFTSGVYSYTGT
jgi:hypothetical protein